MMNDMHKNDDMHVKYRKILFNIITVPSSLRSNEG